MEKSEKSIFPNGIQVWGVNCTDEWNKRGAAGGGEYADVHK